MIGDREASILPGTGRWRPEGPPEGLNRLDSARSSPSTACGGSPPRPGEDFRDVARAFREDGAVLLRGVHNADALQLAERAFDFSVTHPTPAVQHYFPETGGTYLQDS